MTIIEGGIAGKILRVNLTQGDVLTEPLVSTTIGQFLMGTVDLRHAATAAKRRRQHEAPMGDGEPAVRQNFFGMSLRRASTPWVLTPNWCCQREF